ncbi:MAG TPA: translation initiation factor IF-2 [Candidatus Bathyarchaeia archaeon]|nr:translation initiation factor IF-2 [Candidatus Bathyarchaeia archaeon]
MSNDLRTPIVAVLGHVDHGKTTMLDKIRGTTTADQEPGLITQHIGATEVPLNVIARLCGSLLEGIHLPGLLFIDTPGHHAFTTLRARGGALADIAILVVDINEGFQPQTTESLNILKGHKTPFIVAANKIDKIHGWLSHDNMMFTDAFKLQSERTQRLLDDRIYVLIEELYNLGFSSDRYDRIRDFTKNIGVVPTSARTGEGIPDLLMVSLGLAQRFLDKDLRLHADGPAVGTVIEINEEKGFGTTLDTIIYDGVLHAGDRIVVGALGRPIVTKIRALLKPESTGFLKRVRTVTAAAGVKIAAPGIENALAGSPLRVTTDDIDEVVAGIESEMRDIAVSTQDIGVIIKADTIGALEALAGELSRNEVPVSIANLGDVSHRDVVEAETISDPLFSVVLGFNVDVLSDAKEAAEKSKVRLFVNDVIYGLIEEYQTWAEKQKTLYGKKRYEAIVRPGKFKILPGYVFRQNKPAIVGIQVLGGALRNGVSLVREDGVRVGTLKGMQDRGENVSEIGAGKEVAVSIDGPTVGRQINEGDVLYVDVPEKHAKVTEQELYDALDQSDRLMLDEFLTMKRKDNPFWAK